MVDRFTRAALLFDFYGALLTGKQKQIIEMHFMNDLSLSEIGAELGITRQAASILISRAEKNLNHYEDRLGLAKKYVESKRKAEESILILNSIRELPNTDFCTKTKIDTVINNIRED